jgi:hypothetical protein
MRAAIKNPHGPAVLNLSGRAFGRYLVLPDVSSLPCKFIQRFRYWFAGRALLTH